MRKSLAAAALIATLLWSGAAAAQTSWIHVRVMQDDGAKVNVNLPMSLIEVALDIAGKEIMKEGHHMRFGDHSDVDLEDIRRIWSELRESGDAEYVNAVDGDDHVRIFREGDRVSIHVDDTGSDAADNAKVRIEVPFSIVDVLLQGEGDELNLGGAIRELANADLGSLVSIRDDETEVDVWIDNNSSQN